MILTAEIDNYRLDKRTFARRHLTRLRELGYRRDLILYERGYPSREMLAWHLGEGIYFVMRAKETFLNRKRVYDGERDFRQFFQWQGRQYTVRRVVFRLESGEAETLITSLDEMLSLGDLKEIYGKRWGIETEFYSLKHKIQIENFSGYSVGAIRQDYYAAIFLQNVAALLALDAETDSSHRKYTYMPNQNLLIGKLKNRLVKALLRGGETLERFLRGILRDIRRLQVPVRLGRVVSRDRPRRGLKHPPNRKRAI